MHRVDHQPFVEVRDLDPASADPFGSPRVESPARHAPSVPKIAAYRPCRLQGSRIEDRRQPARECCGGRGEKDMRSLWNWLKTVPTLVIIGAVLFMVLTVGGALLLWGANFADNVVHSQLSEQKITFPAKGSPALDPKTFPGLQRYAGQTVDNGPKAKAYADQFIRVHLKEVADGKTYSQVSAESLANPNDQKLAGQTQTLFRGETLRGLLLNVWGWATVGSIAHAVGIASLLGALAVLIALVLGFVGHERARKASEGEGISLTEDETEAPVPAAVR